MRTKFDCGDEVFYIFGERIYFDHVGMIQIDGLGERVVCDGGNVRVPVKYCFTALDEAKTVCEQMLETKYRLALENMLSESVMNAEKENGK